MRKTFDAYKNCFVCGKSFCIKIRKMDLKIMSKCFHGKLQKCIFLGWTYKLDWVEGLKIKEVCYKNTFWKVIGYTKLQREIIYWLWKIWHFNCKVDYWECSKDCKK